MNFYEVTGPNQVLEKTYERGVEDFTPGLRHRHRQRGHGAHPPGPGQRPGGPSDHGRRGAHRRRGAPGDQVTGLYLTGPTNLVAKGEIFDEELVLP